MTPLHALILGIVQGLTEFLPVSSSGHLLLIPHLLNWPEQPLAFDVALHIGTLLAVVIYFRRDWWTLIRETLRDLRQSGVRVDRWGPHGHLALMIGIATVPAVIVGLFLGDLENRLRTPGVVAAMLVLVGGVMAVAERRSRPTEPSGLERLTPVRALLLGMAQACALVPGVSRSGSTISAGMFSGLSRATAARFSFLMATPITLAAAVKELPSIRDAASQGISIAEIALGISASLIVGVLAITFLLRYLATRPLYAFVWYRVALAVVVVIVLVR